jgi:hypothetical protein
MNSNNLLEFSIDIEKESSIQYFFGINKKNFSKVLDLKQNTENEKLIELDINQEDYFTKSEIQIFKPGKNIKTQETINEELLNKILIEYKEEEKEKIQILNSENTNENQELEPLPDIIEEKNIELKEIVIEKEQNQIIPILVVIKNEDSSNNDISYNYITIYLSKINEAIIPQIQQQYVHTMNGGYKVQDIYGIEDSDNNCVVCLSSIKDITLLPCRHLCVCETCFQFLEKCPICRKVCFF